MTLLRPSVARVLGIVTLVALVVLALFGLWGAPPDAVQSDAQRLMYLHVPAAWIAYLAFGVTALGSALWLWPRTRSDVWDRAAGASAELGVLFTGLTILGSLWGRPVWGVWWAWDARLVTTAVHEAAPTSAAHSEQPISLRRTNMSRAPRKNVIVARKVRLAGIGSARLIRKSGS